MRQRLPLSLTLSALLILCATLTATATIPAGYYTSLNGKKDAELKTATYNVIRNLTPVSSYNALPQYFAVTDVYPGSKRWWDMYSNIPLYAPSFYGLNREHSFPKSWWGGDQNVQAYTDLNHLYPAEAAANMAKSNYPMGVVDRSSTVDFDNGMTTVGYAVAGQGGGAKFVFEPDDEYKGDFARTYFYMVTCYQDYKWASKYSWMLQQNTYPTLTTWAINLLLAWHRGDPVSQKEIDRNENVYHFQNNRNPFIDFPELAEYIWGNKKGQVFNTTSGGGGGDTPTGDPNLITPVQDMDLDFGQVALGKSATAKLFFRGENLRGSLDLVLSRGDKSMFSLERSSISASLVNAADGYWLNVTYTPTALGKHETKLIVSEGGITGSRGIVLRGECLAVPTLTAPVATDATDIEDDTYVAHWNLPPDGEVVDYYVVNVTRYANGNATTTQWMAEENSLEIDGFSEATSDSYTVQSVRLGYMSDPSNVIVVKHAGIHEVAVDEPLAIETIYGYNQIRVHCARPHTNMCIYTAAGALYTTLPQVDNNTDITLPCGVYLITTDQAHKPLKAIVY